MGPWKIVHSEASLGWGGQEIRVLSEALAMRARGHRVWMAAQPESVIWGKAGEAGLPRLAFSEKSLRFPDGILRLAGAFRREGIDVVNTHSSKDGWIAGLAARLAGVPCLIRSRHIEVDYPSRWRSRIAFHHLPDLVLTTSGRITERLVAELGLDPGRVRCIPTGIDLERFAPGRGEALRASWGWTPETVGMGMISVIRSWKGHAYFVQAAGEVARELPQVRFIIAGSGPGESRLPALVAEAGLEGRVHVLGHREDVPELLRALDVVVLPSTAHEGIPQILLQAQAVGRAAVGTWVGGIPEVIEDGVNGLLVPPADSAALASALRRLATDGVLRERMARAAGERRERWSLERMCDAVEEAVASVMRIRAKNCGARAAEAQVVSSRRTDEHP
jgi:glycosyltransferase involved in cell wall biosynthesis